MEKSNKRVKNERSCLHYIEVSVAASECVAQSGKDTAGHKGPLGV